MSNAALIHLGGMLRDLRKRHGVTGVELSRLVPLSQSSVSKLETGKTRLPEWTVVDQILSALNAADDERKKVRRQYELAQLDPSSYVYILAHGSDAKQRQIAEVEADAMYIRDYQTAVLPGLLQTPAYSYAVFRELGYSDEASTAAVRERQLRQVILNDPRRRFDFIILDFAFNSPRCGESDFIQQVEYLRARVAARNISIRIMDSRSGVPVRLSNPFAIIDKRFVSAEAATQEITTSNPIEITSYERLFSSFWNFCLDERSSINFIDKLLDSSH